MDTEMELECFEESNNNDELQNMLGVIVNSVTINNKDHLSTSVIDTVVELLPVDSVNLYCNDMEKYNSFIDTIEHHISKMYL